MSAQLSLLNKSQQRKQINTGFTLIELLIVIAIIGVLAATVVVSLGSQTDKAKEGSAKIGVSSIRNLATVAVMDGHTTADGDVCHEIYPKVSGEKSAWGWKKAAICTASQSTTSADSGKICCSSRGVEWVIWSALPTGDGAGGNKEDIYCADSTGFTGVVEIDVDVSNSGTVKRGTGNKPKKCQP